MTNARKTHTKALSLLAAGLIAILGTSSVTAGNRYDQGHSNRGNDNHHAQQQHDRRYDKKRYKKVERRRYLHDHHDRGHRFGHRHQHNAYGHHYGHRHAHVYVSDNDAYKWISLAAVSIKLLDNINEEQERNHDSAYQGRK